MSTHRDRRRHHPTPTGKTSAPILAHSIASLLTPALAVLAMMTLAESAHGDVAITKTGSTLIDALNFTSDTSTLSTATAGSTIQAAGTGFTTTIFSGISQIDIQFTDADQTVTFDSTNFSFSPTVLITSLAAGSITDAIVKNGANTLTLNGTNTYGGGTTINAGAISFNNAGSLGTGAVTLGTGAQLRGTGTVNLADQVNFASGTSTVSTTGTLDLSSVYMTGTATNAVFGSVGNAGIVELDGSGLNSITSTSTIDVAYGTLRNTGGLSNFTFGAASTTVNAGATLSINDINTSVKNLLGNGSVTLGSKAMTTLTLVSGSFGGVISGAGLVEKSGAGTMILTGANTYTGGTIVDAGGTLIVGNASTTGSITGTVADSGSLVFDRSNALTFAGKIAGAGTLTQAGTGTLTLTGTNSYSGGTMINEGVLSINNASALGSGTVTLSRNTELSGSGTVNLANKIVFPGNGSSTVSTSGTLDLNYLDISAPAAEVVFGSAGNAGVVVFLPGTAGSVVAAGNTFDVAFGTLRNGGGLGGYTRVLVTTVNTGATLSLNDFDTTVSDLLGSGSVTLGSVATTQLTLSAGTFSGVISGAGQVMTTSTVTLTGANTYTGGTTVTGGPLYIGNGGATGSIAGNITDDLLVYFDRSNAVTFAGKISGTGSVYKTGAGVLTLTGASS